LVAEFQSFPTASTHELFRVVTMGAVGAPDAALDDFTAPIAPDPLVPVESAPVKLTTVIDAAAGWASVAVTVTLLRAPAANARQISAVPRCAFVLTTNCHASPPPVTPVTVFPALTSSAPTNARTNSFAACVENAAVVSVVSDHPQAPEAYKAKLAGLAGLSHITIEVQACPGPHPA